MLAHSAMQDYTVSRKSSTQLYTLLYALPTGDTIQLILLTRISAQSSITVNACTAATKKAHSLRSDKCLEVTSAA